MSQAQAPLSPARAEPRIQGVKYLNAWPPLYGLMMGREPERVRMALPSVLAHRLANKEADVALAPVATLAMRDGFEVVRGICLGADGDVASVLVVGECSLAEMDRLILDTASKTSVVLAQLIAQHVRRGRSIELLPGDHACMEREVGGRTGAVVIGDHALSLRSRYPYTLDLAGAWKEWTGLPFVFAAWIAQKGIVDEQLGAMLHDSLAHGLSARREIAHLWAAHEGGDPAFYQHYLTHHMRYVLDDSFEAGLREFLRRASHAGLFAPFTLRFAGP